MRPRIALATYDRAPDLAHDDRLLLPALAAAGIDGEPAVWSDDSTIWETFDGVVVRSCWDYHLRYDEFTAWLERLDASRLPVFNSVALVQWNSHKRYLVDLAARGIPTIETEMVAYDADVGAVAAARGWSKVVLKPAISASGFETHALTLPLDDTSRAIVDRVKGHSDALAQPFAEEVPRDGEYSLMFLDGEFSHAAIKRAAASEFRVQTEHGGSVTPITVSDQLVAQAAAVLRALPEMPLYARVDGIVRGDVFLLMELELIEPNLFFELEPGSADRFAAALARRLRDA